MGFWALVGVVAFSLVVGMRTARAVHSAEKAVSRGLMRAQGAVFGVALGFVLKGMT